MIKSETKFQDQKESFSFLRVFFLNLFKILFIIMIYFYVSEIFGSISTPYIKENIKFSIIFSLPLLLLIFFSNLAGPIHGFIAGFFGESFYQISFYNTLYPYWIIIVSIIGLVSGIYKYKPLKYLESMKIYYIFLTLIILSFGLMFLLIIFNFLFNPLISVENLFLNYGFAYFIELLISVVFIVPILLYLYDRILALHERYIYNLFLTHHPIYASDHTYYLKFGRTYFYFCSRCSGIVLGTVISIFFTHLINIGFGLNITPILAVLMCIILPLPGLIDWGTQTLLKRTSNTKIRLFTGFLIGTALMMMSYANELYFLILGITTLYFSILFIMMYIGHRREKKEYERERKKFYEEDI
ncbi:MAG: DUF2085 domain-containing protein [Candidatus Lokiarchaeota archaeon]